MKDNQLLETTDEMEIDLSELFHVLLKKWWMILSTALVGAIIAICITKFTVTPLYQSKAMLYILTKSTSVTSVADLQIGTVITKDFEIIATSKPVIDAAIEQLAREEGVVFTRGQIASMITITNQEDTRILTIEAVSPNPKHACIVANAITEKTASRMAEIMKSDPPTTVERAEVSTAPINSNVLRNGILGFLLGAVAVCGILLVQYMMNNNIRTEEDVEKYLNATTLAAIPIVKDKGNKKEELQKIRGTKRGKKE